MKHLPGRLTLHKTWVAILLLFAASGTLITGSTVYGQAGQTQPEEHDRALALLEEILERPEFQWQDQQQSLLERLWERLFPFLVRLLPDSVSGERLLVLLLAALGLLATAASLTYAARRFRREMTPDAASDPSLAGARARDSEQALHKAQHHSQHGDYRLALRYLYLSTLLLLNERGMIQYDRTRTNREYLQSVAHHPRLKDTLQEMVEIFDHTWYGLAAPDAQTYARFENMVRDLRRVS